MVDYGNEIFDKLTIINDSVNADRDNAWTFESNNDSSSYKIFENSTGNRIFCKPIIISTEIDATKKIKIKYNNTATNSTNCFAILQGNATFETMNRLVIPEMYMENGDYIYAYIITSAQVYAGVWYREV